MTTKKIDFFYQAQVKQNGIWTTVGGCNRSSHTYALILRTAKKFPDLEIRLALWGKDENAKPVNRSEMGI